MQLHLRCRRRWFWANHRTGWTGPSVVLSPSGSNLRTSPPAKKTACQFTPKYTSQWRIKYSTYVSSTQRTAEGSIPWDRPGREAGARSPWWRCWGSRGDGPRVGRAFPCASLWSVWAAPPQAESESTLPPPQQSSTSPTENNSCNLHVYLAFTLPKNETQTDTN